ncbi:MAG TPA: RDD family protein [Bauldia sp.]|nr:RDD family protein [Bauldia sp.]
MSDTDPVPVDRSRIDRYAYDPATRPDLFDGILARRIVAFMIDAILIFLLMIPAALVVFILGFFTFTLAWWILFPPLFAIVALGYVGLTLGGPASATVGMRAVGIEMRTWNGGTRFLPPAGVRAILFWFSVGVLTPLVLLVGLFTRRRQLLHDLVLGVVMVNAAALRRQGS